ncbi:hypothetical protein T492DRAFT_1031094 [Pavlovales sp. CCMP2436]|nr:hypothetical protein T492DRAFT_1031094 [Pavlovales sp. CCMP2436]
MRAAGSRAAIIGVGVAVIRIIMMLMIKMMMIITMMMICCSPQPQCLCAQSGERTRPLRGRHRQHMRAQLHTPLTLLVTSVKIIKIVIAMMMRMIYYYTPLALLVTSFMVNIVILLLLRL